MDSDKKMDVVDWQDSPLSMAPETRAPRHFLPPTLIGVLGTLLLHAILIQSVSLGSRRPNPKLPDTQDSADVRRKSTTDSDGLVLITLPISAKANQDDTQNLVSSLPDLSKMKVKSTIDIDTPALLGLESLALSEDQAPSAIATGANGTERARLFGIYTGQIQARIDRVWRRPRTPINEDESAARKADIGDSFRCQAQIVQDVRGNVQEILLPRCNGSAAWQRSLVRAIQQSSPLPAPPSAEVFTQSITLNFVGLPYIQGASSEEYEIVPLARVDH
jgi:hypothetical protein